MGGKRIPWATVIDELRAQPEVWILHPALCRRSPGIVARVNRYRNPRVLRIPDGTIQAKHGWVGRAIDGRPVADIYLRYRPSKEGANHAED